MNWQEAQQRIHSPQFDAELNVVSGTNAFFRAVRNEPAVKVSLGLMKESGELQEEILDQLHNLAARDTDPNYENPNDTPLAVLLWLTHYSGYDSSILGAQYVNRAPRCWYASKLAQNIINPPPADSSGYSVNFDVASQFNPSNSSRDHSVIVVPSAAKVRVLSTPQIAVYRSDISDPDNDEVTFVAHRNALPFEPGGVRSGTTTSLGYARRYPFDGTPEHNTVRVTGDSS